MFPLRSEADQNPESKDLVEEARDVVEGRVALLARRDHPAHLQRHPATRKFLTTLTDLNIKCLRSGGAGCRVQGAGCRV